MLSLFMANIEEIHLGATHLLMLREISGARSFVPRNMYAVDMTIQETFMQHVKSHAGLNGY